MARGTQHNDETRAQVTAALLTGQGVRETSRALKVPVATVSRIKRDLAAPRAKAALSGMASQVPTDEEFAPDDSATFEADVEAGLRDGATDGEPEWRDSDDYLPAESGRMELSEADESYQCPVQQAKDSGVPMGQLGTQKKPRPSLDELIADYLAENLATLRAQSIIARDPRWIKCYGPENLAILHGVMSDKALRILEFAEAAKPVEVVASG